MSITSKIQEVLAANPGVSWNNLVLRQLRAALSDTTGGVTDLWMRWFAGQGFITGSLQDRMKAYWDANSVPLNERNLFYLGVRAFFSIGPELVVNGGFDTDTVWVKGTGWTITGGYATITSQVAPLSQTLSLTPGLTYSVQYDIVLAAGSFTVRPDLGSTLGTNNTGVGSYTQNIVAGAGTDIVFNVTGISGEGRIDNVSVRQV